MTYGEYVKWYENFDDEMKQSYISVCDAKSITVEWRFVIVDGIIISESQYRPQISSFVPPEVKGFVPPAIQRWCSLPIMAMDIVYVDNEFKVLELNCFNGSSFYAANVNAIVRSVSTYLENRTIIE